MPLNHTLHTATLIDDRLYILNGIEIETQFFYLDVSVTFNTKSIGWTDLSSTNIIPPHTGSTSVKGGPKNNTLFLFGGISWDNMNVLYTFDPRNNSWSTPKTTGVDIITKYGTTGVVDYNGKMYIFDGHGIPFEPSEMLILDTINLSWSRGSLVNAASPRRFYGATLLPNQHIIYLGGFDFDGEKNLPLNEVYLYDTINDSWSTKTTSGAIPSERASFSTVLGLDGQRIIIFGGAYSDPEGLGGVSLIEPRNALCELDLINYEWSIPKTKGQTPNYRAFHEATVIGKYMVISFGIGFGKEEDILLLDISNNTEYVWTDTFVPTLPKPSTPPAQTSKNNGHVGHVIIGAVVGSLTCIFLLIGGVFLYKGTKPKKRYQPLEEVHEVLIPTSGNQESHEALVNPTTPSS